MKTINLSPAEQDKRVVMVNYSRHSKTQGSLRPWQFVQGMGSSSRLEPGNNLGMAFR